MKITPKGTSKPRGEAACNTPTLLKCVCQTTETYRTQHNAGGLGRLLLRGEIMEMDLSCIKCPFFLLYNVLLSFIDVWFTSDQCPISVYSLMSFDKCIHLYTSITTKIQHFHHPQRSSFLLAVTHPQRPIPQTLNSPVITDACCLSQKLTQTESQACTLFCFCFCSA